MGRWGLEMSVGLGKRSARPASVGREILKEQFSVDRLRASVPERGRVWCWLSQPSLATWRQDLIFLNPSSHS
jgi:hypothetical protein